MRAEASRLGTDRRRVEPTTGVAVEVGNVGSVREDVALVIDIERERHRCIDPAPGFVAPEQTAGVLAIALSELLVDGRRVTGGL